MLLTYVYLLQTVYYMRRLQIRTYYGWGIFFDERLLHKRRRRRKRSFLILAFVLRKSWHLFTGLSLRVSSLFPERKDKNRYVSKKKRFFSNRKKVLISYFRLLLRFPDIMQSWPGCTFTRLAMMMAVVLLLPSSQHQLLPPSVLLPSP